MIDTRRFEVPNPYRHLHRLRVRYASWDLTQVHLVDERTGQVLLSALLTLPLAAPMVFDLFGRHELVGGAAAEDPVGRRPVVGTQDEGIRATFALGYEHAHSGIFGTLADDDRLVELDGPVDVDDPTHVALMMLLGVQSKREVLRARFRVISAMRAQARDQGRHLGGRPPHGYRLTDAGRQALAAYLDQMEAIISTMRDV